MGKIFTLLIILIFSTIVACSNKQVEPLITIEGDKLYEVFVKQVLIDQSSGVSRIPVIILTNRGNNRQFLPIWVGFSEGMSINSALKKEESPRPGTHDLFVNVLRKFQMKVVRVVVTEVRNDTYFASIAIESNGETKEIDARSSDAIAIALRTNTPIFISDRIIGKAGWAELPLQDNDYEEEKKEIIRPEIDDSV